MSRSLSEYKYSFENDYSELAHPRVLEALAALGTAQFAAYGEDEHSEQARALIRQKIGRPDADVHFACGGTQANRIVIAAALRPFEAVIAAASGHVNMHETGAIEASGHKVCTRPATDGKLSCAAIESIVAEHTDEHMVRPRLVYISQSTELGSVYKKAELEAIAACCRQHGLYLYIDGARLGAALAAPAADLTYADIARLADAFYIGGTKNGALLGEAIVICHPDLKPDFRFYLKQNGTLLGKSAVIGIEFKALMADGLYDQLAAHAVSLGQKLSEGIARLGYDFFCPTETNQVFPILPNPTLAKIRELYHFLDWQPLGDQTAVRLIASWATEEERIDEFLDDLAAITHRPE